MWQAKFKSWLAFVCFCWVAISAYRVNRDALHESRHPILKRLKRYELIKVIRHPSQQGPNTLLFVHSPTVLVGVVKAFDQVWRFYSFRVPGHRTRTYKNGRLIRTSAQHFQGRLYSRSDSIVLLYVRGNKVYGNIRYANDILFLERWTGGKLSNEDSHILMYRHRDLLNYVDKRTFRRSNAIEIPMTAFDPPDLSRRAERAESEDDRTEQTKSCSMGLVVDPLQAALLGNDPEYVADEMRLMMLMVNRIYETQRFGTKWITFRLNRIDLIDESSSFDTDHDLLKKPTSPDQLLLTFSHRLNHECIAFLITSQAMTSGSGNTLLGLAYHGKPHSVGYCSVPTFLGGRRLRMLNTGIMTSRSSLGVLTRGEQVLTWAHEIGHLIGASHDSVQNECKKNYLMDPHASDPTDHKSRTFSSCSVNYIQKLMDTNPECLNTVQPTCGNGYKEPGEQCDCGSEHMCKLLQDCCDSKTCTLKSDCEPTSPSKLKLKTNYKTNMS